MPLTSNAARLRAAALAVVCAASIGVAACGGDDEESTSTATEATTTEPTTTEDTTTEDTTIEDTTTEDTTTDDTTTEDAPTTETGGVGADIDVEALRDQFNQQLLQVLTTQQGLSQSEAQCAVDELQNTLTDDALREAATTGQPPQELLDAAFDAGVKCAGQ